MPQNVPLRVAIAEYLEHCRARGLATKTILSRQYALNQLADAIGSIQAHRVSAEHVDRVFTRHSWGQSTRNGRASIYRAFFAWCRSRGYMSRDRDPMYGWRYRAPEQKERTRIPRAEWPRLFAACEDTRELVVLGTGLYLFLRASEQRSIQIQHVRLSESLIEIWRPKVRQWDTMPIVAELDPILREHLEALSARVRLEPEHFLIPSGTSPKERHELTGRLVAGTQEIIPTRAYSKPHRIVQRILERCGYPTYWEGEHTLRRSGARAYFDHLAVNGYDGALRRVQSMLGHRTSAMTELYLGLDLDRQRRNDDLRGAPMFDAPGNVVPMRGVVGGSAHRASL